ncbi:hypothetical protein TVAGG3_0379160 [Trichomonas vaginalis G3]|uniref:hypothetical protein n=1 Tax=Trichomonas vaginalis (strain ATCC PRA-98 / G3) TaxID=412133 RepID=UPI0021E59DA7|nr:hypothetical protein TVAGG3_0379160 [Trichomonas vaginalis G3]KAI5533145.1 hypothetical protein TVAGG3_0379160 [Trichomonas vaginalis G3]
MNRVLRSWWCRRQTYIERYVVVKLLQTNGEQRYRCHKVILYTSKWKQSIGSTGYKHFLQIKIVSHIFNELRTGYELKSIEPHYNLQRKSHYHEFSK